VSWLLSHRYWLARRATAAGILALFWLGAHAHVGVLTGNLSSSRVLRTIPLSDPFATLQILAAGQPVATTALVGAAIVLLFYWAVGGRAFCGWVCPIDPLRELAGSIRERLDQKGQFRVGASARFWILGLAFPVSALTGVAAFEWLSPIGMLHRSVIFGAGAGLWVVGLLLLTDVFLARRGWCGSLCPLGAFYSLVGRYSPMRVGFEADRCDHCGDCVKVCPEPQVIDFDRMKTLGVVDSGDCLNCARCLEVCPQEAYHFTLRLEGAPARGGEEGENHANQSAA
jgi:ferredoxin-type protein NapH